MEIAREPLDSADARALIAALDAELSALYPEPGATHFRLDDHEAFVVARRDGIAVGCGAVRRIDDETFELKRMYVIPSARAGGIGGRILAALEAEAQRLGAARIVLETGSRQTEAIALYRGAGYVETAPFGEYVGSPLSVCLEKRW